MSSLTEEDLALISAYLTNYSAGDKSYFWAYEEISGMEDPERLWRLTLEMIRITSDAGALAYIAAGPLEEMLNHYGDQCIEHVEKWGGSSGDLWGLFNFDAAVTAIGVIGGLLGGIFFKDKAFSKPSWFTLSFSVANLLILSFLYAAATS